MGFTAEFSDDVHGFIISSDDPKNELVLDSGETGFFSASRISDGAYSPTDLSPHHRQSSGLSRRKARQIANAMKDVAMAMNAILGDSNSRAAHETDTSVTRLQDWSDFSSISDLFFGSGTADPVGLVNRLMEVVPQSLPSLKKAISGSTDQLLNVWV